MLAPASWCSLSHQLSVTESGNPGTPSTTMASQVTVVSNLQGNALEWQEHTLELQGIECLGWNFGSAEVEEEVCHLLARRNGHPARRAFGHVVLTASLVWQKNQCPAQVVGRSWFWDRQKWMEWKWPVTSNEHQKPSEAKVLLLQTRPKHIGLRMLCHVVGKRWRSALLKSSKDLVT